MKGDVLLSICIPAYNRPHWLRRALTSIINQNLSGDLPVEFIVSDDSTNAACGHVARELLQSYLGPSQYEHQTPRLGMVGNWNQTIRMARGQYILILHDDDFLPPTALSTIVHALQNVLPSKDVLLFGVNIVDENERVIRRQSVKSQQYLAPKKALQHLITNSSFIRFPGVVVRRAAFENVGLFDASAGYPADLDMWIRLASKYGIYRFPDITANYTIHERALTMQMFNLDVIQTLWSLIEKANQEHLFDDHEFERYKTFFFHQFVLAGTVRSLKQRNWKEARKVFSLLHTPPLDSLAFSWKWFPLRIVLSPLLLISGDTEKHFNLA